MGTVILESTIWLDLTWLDIPNLTDNSIDYGEHSFEFTADLQATSTFHFIFISFVDADGLRDFIILHSKYNLVQEGMQLKDHYFVPPNQSIEEIPANVEHLYFCGFSDYAKNELILSNNSFPQLKSITIDDECFKHVREFVVDGLVRLESVKTGEKCFRMGGRKRDDGICRITNCPNLRHLDMGRWSFVNFQLFELSNVNSLQSIQFGYYCFECAEKLLLKGRREMWLWFVNDVELNEWWCFRSSIIRNRCFWRMVIYEMSCCCIWKYVMIAHLIWFDFSF